MLELRGISKAYAWRARPAVDHVSLNLNPGEIVGLVGLNGAGKTTSLRVACGVLLASSGEVFVDGVSMLHDKDEASRFIGWIPEQPTHDPGARVRSLVRYYSDIAREVPYSVGDQLLGLWGMDDYARRRFRELSLGYKRRLAVVVASLTNPRYYLLDEPFNGLDPAAMVQFRTWIRQVRDKNCGVLLSSHNLREVQDLADRLIVIHRGRLIASMKSTELAKIGHKQVAVVLDRIDGGAIAVMQRFGQASISGTTATIRGAEVDPGTLNAALVREGYVVVRLTAGESDLEEYFLKLVGEAA